MRDDFLTAEWARDHGRLTDALATIVTTVRTSLATLNAYHFDAPWRHDAGRAGRGSRRHA
ncbi:MAG: hypothetical protein V4537_12930 [Pseudomonadota bacterium]